MPGDAGGVRTVTYLVTGEDDIDRLLARLGSVYSCKKEPEATETITIYDTFDWRLSRKSIVLYTSDDFLCLRRRNECDVLHRLAVERPPVFLRDLPDGALKAMLAPILEARALMKLVELISETTSYRVVNADGKTVVRLTHERIRPRRHRQAPLLGSRLWLRPIMGYRRHFRTVAAHMEEAGLVLTHEDIPYERGLDFVGKKPSDYSTKINLALSPEMRADMAAKEILRMLLRIIRINEAELAKDLDTEFLHDFRVAIRRTRSALGQIPDVFPPGITERFKRDFSFAGRLTNELRDLDVWLLEEESCKAKLAPSIRGNIDPVFAGLREERARAFQAVVRQLKSRKFRKFLEDWEAFLSAPEEGLEQAPNAAVPIAHLARERILRRYRRVVKAGSRIVERGEDEKLHALRIRCKKLRYLMEFLSSLFPREKIGVLVGQVKKLHDDLGAYNDLRIQEDFLLRTGRASSEDPLRKETLIAIGNLVGALDAEKRRVKCEFRQTFAVFTSSATRAMFDELFAPNGPPSNEGAPGGVPTS